MSVTRSCRLATRAASTSTSTSAAAAAASSATTEPRLKHLRIASPPATHSYPAYADVERLQAKLQRLLLDWKAGHATSGPSTASPNPPPSPPPPTLISFTPKPTYTLGRRQTGPLDDAELARLTASLTVTSSSSTTTKFHPAVVNAPRGGLATYHGPGQVVFWPVIDLHSPLHKHFSVRDYACLLEKTTIAALARFSGGLVRGFTTENPGVWVRHGEAAKAKAAAAAQAAAAAKATRAEGGVEASGDRRGSVNGKGNACATMNSSDNHGNVTRNHDDDADHADERKISAMGVHLRRHVTGLGVAVNFGMPVAGPEATNPWARIVACGLGDKGVTSIAAEYGERAADGDVLAGQDGGGGGNDDDAAAARTADALADIWAGEFAARLGLILGDTRQKARTEVAQTGEPAVDKFLVDEMD